MMTKNAEMKLTLENIRELPVKELRAIAKEKGIKLGRLCVTKEQIVQRVSSQLGLNVSPMVVSKPDPDPELTIETLNEMTTKELKAVAKDNGIKLGRLCVTKNLVKVALLNELFPDWNEEKAELGPLAQAEADAAKPKPKPSRADAVKKVLNEVEDEKPEVEEEVSPKRMKVVKQLVAEMGTVARINDMWIWIFESNENHHPKLAEIILTDREIAEFMRLATGKHSQVFKHVSMVRGRLHRGLLFTKTGRQSFEPGRSCAFERDMDGKVTRRDARTRSRSMQCLN